MEAKNYRHYLVTMKNKYPESQLLKELNIGEESFEIRDCCTEVVSALNDEQIENIVINIKMLEDEGFFELEEI